MFDPTDVFSGPAVTALGLAASRAVESDRPDRLICDPLARAFFKAAGVNLPMRLDWPDSGAALSDAERLHLHGSCYIGLRTRFYDDVLLRAANRGLRQGVLIGAGLDARAFRLALPADFRLIELDQAPLLEWKETVLGDQAAIPRCRRSRIGTDLREDWSEELARLGFNPLQPAAFVAEGVLPYLTADEQRDLLRQINALATNDSVVALDRIVGDPHAAGGLASLSRRSGLDMTQLLAPVENNDITTTLQDDGWSIRETPVADIAASYQRDLTDPFATTGDTSAVIEPPWFDTRFLHGTR
jgi:methyltransferase (TIGR00027 family)